MLGFAGGLAPKPVTGIVHTVLVLFFVLLLGACGGGGGGGDAGGSGGGSGGSTATNSTVSGGSPSNPATLKFPASFPVGSVMKAGEQLGFFKVVGLVPNEDYFVDVISNGGIGFNGYLTSNITNPSINDFSCFFSNACTSNAQGELYILAYLINPASADIPYTIAMHSLVSEGSMSAPKDVTALLPYSATLPESGFKSYLVVGGLTKGNSYTIALSDTSDSRVSLSVYQDNFQTRACLASSSKSCTQTAASTRLWVKVKGTGDYQLTLIDNGLPAEVLSAEGTITYPVMLSYANDGLLAAGQVGYTSSYYDVTGLTPGGQYRFVLNNIVSDNVNLAIYRDSSFTTQTCLSENSSTAGEECVATADNTGNLWVRVIGDQANRYLGANYDMIVYRFYANQGTYSERVVLNYSNGFSYNGEVDSYSYYRVDGLAANTTYLLDVSNFTAVVSGSASSYQYSGSSSCNMAELSTGVQRCLITSGDTGQVDVRVDESTRNIGSDFTLDISLSPNQSEGSELTPVVLNMDPAGISVAAEVGGVNSYYRIDGLTPGAAYTIDVTGMLNEHGFYVYDDVASLWVRGNAVCSSTAGKACTRQAVGSSLWLLVGERSYYNAINGAALTISVNKSAFQSEGSLASPVALAASNNSLPYSGSVDTSASFYTVDGLTPGTEYVVVVRNVVTNNYVYLYVYDDMTKYGSTTYPEYNCNIYVSTADTYCRITPTGTSLGLMMEGSSSTGAEGAFYDLDISVAPKLETVTLDASVISDVFPRASSSTNQSSRYTVTNLLASQLYYVSIDNLTADIDVAASASSSISSACDQQTSITSESCLVVSGTDGVLKVNTLGDKTLYGAFFDLNLVKGPSDEGTAAAPIEVLHNTAQTVRSSQVGVKGSYYRISGLTAGRLYEIDLTSIDGGAVLNIHKDSAYNNITCGDFDETGADLKCGGLADISGSIYVKVRQSGYNRGSLFNLQIKAGLLPEGSSSAGVDINYTAGATTHAGQVDLTSSYYVVNGLSPKSSYTISLTGLSDNVDLYVYNDAAYSNQVCSSQYSLTVDESCNHTLPAGGGTGTAKLYVRVSGSKTVAGATYTVEVAP